MWPNRLRLVGLGAVAAAGMTLSTGLSTTHADQAGAMKNLAQYLKKTADLQRVSALAEWDQLVMMPSQADTQEERGNQLATLASIIHARETAADLGELIRLAEGEPSKDRRDQATVREARRRFNRATKIPADLAEKKAKLASSAYAGWAKAREENDYASFRPLLADCFKMAQDIAQCTREKEVELYDVCLSEFEPGMTAQRLDELFEEVKKELKPLVTAILAAKHAPSTEPLKGHFPKEAQAAFNERLVRAIGFAHGRLDVSVHPFTTSVGGPTDVRITTRYKESEWLQGTLAAIHEGGHALYEQGLGRSGLPVDEALSMGVHESQSLFWERHVGLSRPFWSYAGPLLRSDLGVMGTDEELYAATNAVSPSLIRVEADECTYPMHVIMRYELERDLIRGKITVDELPTMWNSKMKDLLGVDVPNDRSGVLQDVHWSALAIGYFATYLIGAMMAAQLAHYIRRDLPDFDERVGSGDFGPIRAWLGDHVHQYGSVHANIDDLLQESVGETLNPKYLLDYLKDKYRKLYDL